MDTLALFARPDVFARPDAWASLLTLTALEIVLGVDNLVFVALATQGLPPDRAVKAEPSRARHGGGFPPRAAGWRGLADPSHHADLLRSSAMPFRRATSSWSRAACSCSIRARWKSTRKSTPRSRSEPAPEIGKSFWKAIFQIAVLDIVFSLDSVLTAIGMAENPVMAAAVVIAVGLMIFAAGPVGRFIRENPTVKMLALAFLLLIGVTLVADGAGYTSRRASSIRRSASG